MIKRFLTVLVTLLMLIQPAYADVISKPYTWAPNTPLPANQLNANFDTIYNNYNGSIADSNIKPAAAIQLSKLAIISTFFDKMATGNVTLGSGITGDANPRVAFTSDGWLVFGPGTTSPADTGIFRTSAGTLTVGNGNNTALGNMILNTITANTLTLPSAAANLVFATPSGSSGPPSFRALTLADFPGGLFNAIAPTTATGGLIIGTGTNAYGNLGIGTNGQILTSNGTTANWVTSGGGTGTVTSVGLSTSGIPLTAGGTPVTTSGTLSLTPSAAKGDLWAGSALNVLSTLSVGTNGQILTADSTTGTGIKWATPAGGTGTVTSVAMTGDGTIYNSSITGSPITSSGTLAPTLHTQTANTFLAGGISGGVAAPTFRNISLLDLPIISTALGGTGVANTPATGDLLVGSSGVGYNTFARGAANLPLTVNGAGTNLTYQVLQPTGGGTGTALSTVTNGDILIANSGAYIRLPIGTAGQALTVNGGATAPVWTTLGGGSGTVTSMSSGNFSPLFTTSVATATTTPALSFTASTAAAHTYYGNNTGSTATPAFSSIVAADLPTIGLGGGGTGQTTASAAFNALAPATAAGGLIVGTGTNTYGNLAVGTNTQFPVLASGTPAWQYGLTGGIVAQNTTATLTNTTASFVSTNPGATPATLTLPAANSCSGKVFTFEYVAGSAATTLATNATNSDKFDGASSATTITLNTVGQTITMESDGANPGNWRIIHPLTAAGTGLTVAHAAGVDTIALSTPVSIANGGTNGATASAGFNNLSPITTTGDLILGTGTNTAGRLAIGTNTQVLTSNGTTASWVTPSGGGSVTSFSSGNLSPLFTTSVATATTTPAQTFSLSTAAAHSYLGNNTGSTAAPAYSSIVAADLPNIPIAGGGTGQTTATTGFNALSPMTTAGDIIVGGTSGAGTRLGVGSNTQVLTVVSGAPAWAAAGSGSGTVNSGTSGQLAYYASTGTAVSGAASMATISGGALTLGVAGFNAGSTVYAGSTSGTTTLNTPAVSGAATGSLTMPTVAMTLPTVQSTGTTQFLTATSGGVCSWATPSGGGSPGGSNTQVQFNSAGAFSADANMTYPATGQLVLGVAGTAGGELDILSAGSGGVLMTSPVTGSSVSFVLPSVGTTEVTANNIGTLIALNTTGTRTYSNPALSTLIARTTSFTAIAGQNYNVSGATNTMTLPTAIGVTGRFITTQQAGTCVMTVNTTSSQTFGGSASGAKTFTSAAATPISLIIWSDNANWHYFQGL